MKKGIHYAWVILACCCVMMMVGIGIFNSCAGIFFMPVSKELGIGVGQLSLYITIQSLVSMFIMPFTGKLFNKVNISVLLGGAFALLAVAFGAMSAAKAVWWFYICGALIGVACAFILYMPVPILINSWFKEKSGMAMGIAMAFAGVGAVIFNPIVNALVQSMGWRKGYIMTAVIGAVIVLPFVLFVVRSKPADKGLLPYGAKEGAAAAAAAGQLEGVPAAKALKSTAFVMTALFAGVIIMGSGITSHIPGIAANYGFSTAIGATAASMLGIGVIIGKLLIGFLSDKLGPAKGIIINLIAGCAGLVMVLFNGGSSILLYGGVILLGFGTCLGTVSPALVAKTAFGVRDYNVIYSYISTVSSLAGAISISLYGFVYDATSSYAVVLYILLGAFVLSGIFSTIAVKSAKKLEHVK